jgi:hypothetical protein
MRVKPRNANKMTTSVAGVATVEAESYRQQPHR